MSALPTEPQPGRRLAAVPDRPSRARLRAAAVEASRDYGGVLSRSMLRGLGFASFDIRREVRQGRWQVIGFQSVATHTGDLGDTAQAWIALWNTGIGCATLDGASALIAAGLTGWSERHVHVSVPRGAQCPHPDGVRVHRVRRLVGESSDTGMPRARPEYAAVRAAHWAASDRAAATILAMAVQQRLTTAERLRVADLAIGGRTRRAFLTRIIEDIADGAHSLGELDFTAMCRRHGLPPPDRQVVRTTAAGRCYLDARWPGGLVVEIDGSGHRQGVAVMDDNLRQNEITLGADRVLRFDLLALRLSEAEVMDQVRRGLS